MPSRRLSAAAGDAKLETDQANKEGTMKRNAWLVLLLAFTTLLAPGTGWPALAAAQQEQKAVSDGKINVNTASKAELMKLKGIGASVADKIIEYRNVHGPFKKPEDIRKVRGVGKGLWEQNRDAIAVE